jgi:NTP pyrophosphatase (non-canonical NTP hydrolase)
MSLRRELADLGVQVAPGTTVTRRDLTDPTSEVGRLRAQDSLTRVEEAVRTERARQDAKWGEQNCHDFEWVSILGEEFGEVARAANEANFQSGKNRGDFTHLRTELVQVAAVAAAWIEALDRRNAALEVLDS